MLHSVSPSQVTYNKTMQSSQAWCLCSSTRIMYSRNIPYYWNNQAPIRL